MNAGSPGRPRVVVALDPGGSGEFTLDLARHLAPPAVPELFGLLVENARLIELAGSTLAREFLLTGGERQIEAGRLDRQLRARAARVRAEFEAAATRLGLPHTFQTARGEPAAELLSRVAGAEALVLSIADEVRAVSEWYGEVLRHLLASTLPMILFARKGWLSGHGITVIGEDIARIRSALQLAAPLARYSRSPLSVALAGAAAAQRERHVEELGDALTMLGIVPDELIALRSAEASAVVATARARRARLLILASPAMTRDADLLEALVRSVPSALLAMRR